MNKVTNCFEGINFNLGFVVLRFKKPNVSEVTIARESHRRNEYLLSRMSGFFVWVNIIY
ncbi:hypothetical protein PVK73_17535 [Bacillus thuringiensis]